ncbi:hypothetical protein GGQ79_000098 [Ochrobactrum pecoris]|uniref:Uncharacterized protein n=1 Tax=Brucella pecoris TaxID=867683 RepID=A0AB34YLM2_9HYPH|nr:hypothetical protein [Brucella pecoris]
MEPYAGRQRRYASVSGWISRTQIKQWKAGTLDAPPTRNQALDMSVGCSAPETFGMAFSVDL